MSWLDGALHKLRETVARRRVEAELEEEIRFHLQREVESLVDEGMDPEAARDHADREFGRVGHIKELVRGESGFLWLESVVLDLRQAVRGLRSNPGFAAVAVLTLGLGVGATTAIFSIVNSVVLAPLPYPKPDRLVRLFQQNSATNRWGLSAAEYLAIREQQTAFEFVAALRGGHATLSGRGPPERIEAWAATADWFRTIGVEPSEGRGFLAGEDRPGSARVVVLSHAFRDRVFGRDADVLGRSVTLDGEPHVVVGVLPPGRETLAGYRAEAWPILQMETPTRRGPFILRGFARLRPGVPMSEARLDLEAISERIFPVWVAGFTDRTAVLVPYALRDVIVGDIGNPLFLLFGAVGGVLLIAIANVANLLLVRATTREQEIALRTMLGATKGRVARQLLTESLLLAALGGVAGVALAYLGLETIVSTSPNLPRLDEVALDGRVLGFASAVTLTSGFIFGLAPLLHSTVRELGTSLRAGGRTASQRAGWARVRGILVTVEFAVALPLLVGSGLLLGSFLRLRSVGPGYDPDHLIAAQVALPAAAYPENADVIEFWDAALARIGEIPGVMAAGISTSLPPHGNDTNNFDLLDRPVPVGAGQHVALWSWATPGYFEALGVALLKGRLPDEEDGRSTPPVVVVSESWARRYYPEQEVLGKQLYAGGDTSNPMTVIGVIGDVKFGGLSASDDAAVYEPFVQASFRSVSLLVRASGSSGGVLGQLQEQIGSLDPGLPLANVETMRERLSASLAEPRYWTLLLGLFAALGLLLAAVGIYGVMSYYVRRQSRDIGIRIALGADPSAVRQLVIRRGMSRAALGITLGLATSLSLTRWLDSLLFEVSPTDPETLGGMVFLLAAIAFLACYLPASQATRIDPIRTLGVE